MATGTVLDPGIQVDHPKHPCRSCTPKDKAFCHTIKTVQDQPEEHYKDLKVKTQVVVAIEEGCWLGEV